MFGVVKDVTPCTFIQSYTMDMFVASYVFNIVAATVLKSGTRLFTGSHIPET
jgi:small basic protein